MKLLQHIVGMKFKYFLFSALNELLKDAQKYARVTGQEEHCPDEKLKKLIKSTSGSEKTSSRKESEVTSEDISEDEDGFRFKAPSLDYGDIENDFFF